MAKASSRTTGGSDRTTGGWGGHVDYNMTPMQKAILSDIQAQFPGIRVTSGYRSPEYNATLTGAAKNSQHIHHKATDVSTSNMTDTERARLIRSLASNPEVTGIGTYPDRSVHFDSGDRKGRKTWNRGAPGGGTWFDPTTQSWRAGKFAPDWKSFPPTETFKQESYLKNASPIDDYRAAPAPTRPVTEWAALST